MTHLTTPLIATIVLSAAVAMARPSAAQDLAVTFEGIKTPTGAIMVALFDSEATFDSANGQPLRSVAVPATSAQVQTVFKDLPAGRYGIKSFHDVDGDGKMATNPFGMPTEPFAFSNKATIMMGPPKWAEAAFSVDALVTTHIMAID
jgi:uncharacterized protein (DUF2141 family)